MFRIVATTLFTAATAMAAQANDLTDLSADLERYIAEFDLSVMNEEELGTVVHILQDATTSHGHKVLALHSVLDQRDALRHVDMHGARNLLTADMR